MKSQPMVQKSVLQKILYLWMACTTACLANVSESESATASSGTSEANEGDTGISATDSGSDGQVPLAFYPLGPTSYARKIKSLLTGGIATTDEISTASTDAGLAQLVDTWMQSQQYQDTLLDFFGLATQQSQFVMAEINDQFPYGNHPDSVFTQDIQEVIPRTLLNLAQNNQPFNQMASTQTFMLTTRLLLQMAVIDASEPPSGTDYYRYLNPNFKLAHQLTGGATDISDLTNTSSPNYLIFSNAQISSNFADAQCKCLSTGCAATSNQIVIDEEVYTYSRAGNLWDSLQGNGFLYFEPNTSNHTCYLAGSNNSFLTAQDDNWRLVTIAEADASHPPADVWDLKKFRNDSVIYFRIPRVGYFTSMAFLAQWATNINNQSRVTINQTLIAGLHKTFDGTDQTQPTDLSGLTGSHALPQTPCYGCHLTMDPMREYFRNAMTPTYHKQFDPNALAITGAYAQEGTSVGGGNLLQLGQQIANSRRFGLAWAIKVCNWLNNSLCAETDPEIIRIAQLFTQDNYNFNTLVKNIVISPITTYKSATQSAVTLGSAPSASRKDQICRMLSNRLSTPDLCKLKSRTVASTWLTEASSLMQSYPADGYARATKTLTQPTQFSVPSRLGLESICGFVALQFIDDAAASDPNTAIDTIVTGLLGLSIDANADVRNVLGQHYQSSVDAGAGATAALQSTFTLSCMSPYLTMIGL